MDEQEEQRKTRRGIKNGMIISCIIWLVFWCAGYSIWRLITS